MTKFIHHFLLVRMKGLEPSRLTVPAPKAGVSTIPPHPRISINIIAKYIHT